MHFKSDNLWVISGFVASVQDLKYTQQGKAVMSISIPVNQNRFDEEKKEWVTVRTAWYKMTFWEEMAENLNEDVQKGTQVEVEFSAASLEANAYIAQDGTPQANLQATAKAYRVIMPSKKSGDAPKQPSRKQEAEEPVVSSFDDF